MMIDATARESSIAEKIVATEMGHLAVPVSVPQNKRERAGEILEILDRGLRDRKIWNVDYKDARDFLNRALDAGGNVLQSVFLDHWRGAAGTSWPKMAEDVYYGFPSGLHQLGSFAKAVSRYDGFLKKEMEEFVNDWLPIAKAFKDLAPFIEKGRKVDPDAPVKVRYEAPRSTTEGVKMIQEALRKVVDAQASILVGKMAESYVHDARKFLEEPVHRRPGRGLSAVYRYFHSSEMAHIVSKLLDEDRDSGNLHLASDAGAKANKLAQGQVDSIVERYLFKNTNKVGSIVERKGGLEDIKISYGSLVGWGFQGELVCTFQDGTRFTVRNKVVYKSSVRGDYFVQFPTTFHDITWPDGRSSAMLSEEQMNEEWAKARPSL